VDSALLQPHSGRCSECELELRNTIAARLNAMGIDAVDALASLKKPREIPYEEDIAADEDRAALALANKWRMSGGAERWVELLASSPEDPPDPPHGLRGY
jgi:hypothetical protein